MQQIDTDYYVQVFSTIHDESHVEQLVQAPRQDMQEFAQKQGIQYPQ